MITFDRIGEGSPFVKDSIEAIGVPHPEVDLILVVDVSVGFDHLLNGGERLYWPGSHYDRLVDLVRDLIPASCIWRLVGRGSVMTVRL